MNCKTHENHEHKHGPGCGHQAIRHQGHVDYAHEGHLHHLHAGHVDDHELAESAAHPVKCTPGHDCGEHEGGHVHGARCGHEAIPHAGHTDYLVGGHLHHPHNGHCDDHGQVEAA